MPGKTKRRVPSLGEARTLERVLLDSVMCDRNNWNRGSSGVRPGRTDPFLRTCILAGWARWVGHGIEVTNEGLEALLNFELVMGPPVAELDGDPEGEALELPSDPPAKTTRGVDRIRRERIRQLEELGYDHERDDKYQEGELVDAANEILDFLNPRRSFELDDRWGIIAKYRRRDDAEPRLLEIAAALLAAELDRRERAEREEDEEPEGGEGGPERVEEAPGGGFGSAGKDLLTIARVLGELAEGKQPRRADVLRIIDVARAGIGDEEPERDDEPTGRLPWERQPVAIERGLLAFLHGEGPLLGYHFGEGPPDGEGSTFWWRRHLPSVDAKEVGVDG